jgi:hypothetical protein
MAKADRDLLIVENQPRVSKLSRFFPILAVVLGVTLALPAARSHTQQGDPVYVYCWTAVHSNHRIDFYSRIFISDSGVSADWYKDPFEGWILQNNPPMRDTPVSTFCSPNDSLDTATIERSNYIDFDNTHGNEVVETK